METGPERTCESTGPAGEFPAEAADLRNQLRDLVAMLVLPAVWSGRDTAQILEALLDILRSMLRLDLAYIRTQDPAGGGDVEVTRTQESDSGNAPQAIASLVAERLAKREWSEPQSLAHPASGELLHAVRTALTVEGGTGQVVAASRRSGFPTSFERFLLQSAVTQAEIALRNAGLNEQLEQRVLERTRELTAVNEQLRREILERKRAEEDLARLHRNLQTLYQCNQALVLATEEDDLLRSVCRILVDVAGLKMAWVGYRELDAKKTVRPVAWAGWEYGYLKDLAVTWAETERGQGPIGIAIRTGEPCWIRDIQIDAHSAPWRTEALKRGFASSIALPLMADGQPFGALALYAEKPDAFNERTLEQFTELANNLAYGVIALRTREERKRSEEALRKTQAELAHVTRVTTMGELTASIAHEVNQPLAAVVTNAHACLRWLAHEVPQLGEARSAVERIIRDGNRASEVIRRMRALTARKESQKAPLDINDVIREVVEMLEGEALRHEVALRAELAPALPPVLGDRIQLQQVILNLAINGIEATAPVRDRPREVLIRSHPHDTGQVLIAVQDSGIGIEPKHQDRLFTAFFTTKPAGMGMGLSISESIVDSHSGRLWGANNVGPGATFQFTLPPYRESEIAPDTASG